MEEFDKPYLNFGTFGDFTYNRKSNIVIERNLKSSDGKAIFTSVNLNL